MVKSFFQEAIIFLLVLGSISGLVLGVLYLGQNALNDQEISECHQLKHYSETIKSFYLEQWQKDMCDAHGIEIKSKINSPSIFFSQL